MSGDLGLTRSLKFAGRSWLHLPLLFLALALPAHAAISGTQRVEINAAVLQYMQAKNIPGLALGIAQGDYERYVRGYGVRDLSEQIPVDEHTVFPIASLTKSFTAAAIMELVEQRRIGLNDPVTRFLPSYTIASDVTVRELLNQTSGIPDYSAYKDFAIFKKSIKTPQDILRRTAGEPLDFAPGTRFAYSNSNYVLLGAIIETVTAQTYESYLKQTFFEPLHLAATDYAPDDLGCERCARSPQELPTLRAGYSAAGLRSDVQDVLSWDTAIFSGRAISESALRQMLAGTRLPGGANTHYGFGYYLRSMNGVRVVGQTGMIDGFSADNETMLDAGEHIVLLCNANGVDLLPLTKSIVGILNEKSR